MPKTIKKIAILVEQLGKGGAERSAGLLSKMFAMNGHEVFMITITACIEYDHGGTLINLGVLKNKANNPTNKFKRLLWLRSKLRVLNIEIILDFRFRQNIYKEYIVQKFLYRGIGVVYMVRNWYLPYYFPRRHKWTRRLFKNALSINVMTATMRDHIMDEYGFNNISVIPSPIDLKDFDQIEKKTRPIEDAYIVTAGRMYDDVKQIDRLIETYGVSELPKKGIKLVILGRGQMRVNYEKLATELGLHELVLFAGFKEDVYTYFQHALYVVLCSAHEGFPRVLLESLACGTPVVAMDCPTGPREIINHGVNGLLIPANDFEVLRQAMNLLIDDKDLRSALKENARASVEKFDFKNCYLAWNELLNS